MLTTAKLNGVDPLVILGGYECLGPTIMGMIAEATLRILEHGDLNPTEHGVTTPEQ